MAEKRYIIPFFIPHIGCPHACVFCNQNSITGIQDPLPPETIIPTVLKYIATFPDRTKRVEIAFFGGSFTGIPKTLRDAYLKEAYTAKDRGLIDGIRLSTRPDCIYKTVLCDLKEFGVDTIELGVQSMDNDVLKKSGRGHCAKDVADASALIKYYGFELGLQMMVGLPGSDKNTEIKTAELICSLKPGFVRVYPVLVVKGTGLEAMYNKGIYRPLPLVEAVDICVLLSEVFIRERVNIIRMGLQPTSLISDNGDVIAGPFHPSFRQLVDSKLMLRVVKKVIAQRGLDTAKDITIGINPRKISVLQGIKKENVISLKNAYPGTVIRIVPNETLTETELQFKNCYNFIRVDYRRVIEKGAH